MTSLRIFRSIPVCLLLVACGGPLSGAKSDFKSARVAEAKDKLVALEPESRQWSVARRAEYALYRGLVHSSLGDRDSAKVWLSEAKAIEDAHPRTLSEDDRARLLLGLDALGVDARERPPTEREKYRIGARRCAATGLP